MIALVSANFGGIDPVFALPERPAAVSAFYFTDGLAQNHTFADRTWTRTVIEPPSGNPRLRAKWFKCQIPRLGQTYTYAHMAWSDSCFRFASLDFLLDWAERVGLDGSRAVLVPHPDRKTVAEEYSYVLDEIARGNPYLASRYPARDLEREREHFGRRHDLDALPLYSGGIWLFANAPQTYEFFDAWWNTVRRFSIFDQAAITPLLVESGIEVVAAPLYLYRNPVWERVVHCR